MVAIHARRLHAHEGPFIDRYSDDHASVVSRRFSPKFFSFFSFFDSPVLLLKKTKRETISQYSFHVIGVNLNEDPSRCNCSLVRSDELDARESRSESKSQKRAKRSASSTLPSPLSSQSRDSRAECTHQHSAGSMVALPCNWGGDGGDG